MLDGDEFYEVKWSRKGEYAMPERGQLICKRLDSKVTYFNNSLKKVQEWALWIPEERKF